MILVLIGTTLGLTGMMYACIPVSQRLTSPVVCPAGTTESVVVAWDSHDGSGKSHAHSELYCIDGEGGGVEPSSVKILLALLGYAAVVVGMTYVAGRFVLRLRATKATA